MKKYLVTFGLQYSDSITYKTEITENILMRLEEIESRHQIHPEDARYYRSVFKGGFVHFCIEIVE